jgi:hypothetical protein
MEHGFIVAYGSTDAVACVRVSFYPSRMATLSRVRCSTLAIVCEPCGRRGRYSVERLLAKHGDMRLTDLRVMLAANCPKARSTSFRDPCKAHYDPAPLVSGPLPPPQPDARLISIGELDARRFERGDDCRQR